MASRINGRILCSVVNVIPHQAQTPYPIAIAKTIATVFFGFHCAVPLVVAQEGFPVRIFPWSRVTLLILDAEVSRGV